MNKKITLNGIELSHPNYDSKAVTFFDYLENVVTSLEEELEQDDGTFQLSINVDFSTTDPPKHIIYSTCETPKKTEEKVARILRSNKAEKFNHVSGSVRVNLKVENK